MKDRVPRINSLIHEELSKLIARELEFEGLVTITNVETASDLHSSLVSVSVLPSSGSAKAMGILNRNHRIIQKMLTKKVDLYPMPAIRFKLDEGAEKAARIEKLLLEDRIEEE